jgi:acyl dehydratase
VKLHLDYGKAPWVPAFMLRALYPSPGLPESGVLAPIRATWRQHRVERGACERLTRVTGLDMERGGWLLYPQVFGFRLQMVVVTHPAFPLPIFRALAFRNHLLLHRPLPLGATVDLDTRVSGTRVQEKGAEVDVTTAVTSGTDLVWEGVTTFYYRGRYGAPGPASPLAASPQLGARTAAEQTVGEGTAGEASAGERTVGQQTAGERTVATWTTPVRGGWEFARLTGDYNGIHWSYPYARLFGFPSPFHHPQSALGQSLARLTPPAAPYPHRLDVWLKGPVFYGAEVELRAAAEAEGSVFALIPLRDGRPAIVGRWWASPAGSRLLDGQGAPR